MKTEPVTYFDRISKKLEAEAIYGEKILSYLYKKNRFSRFLVNMISKRLIFSRLYGLWQHLPFSKKKIIPFIRRYHINSDEFLFHPTEFKSFNDFFCRKLRPEARPIEKGQNVAIIPADGRYLVYPKLDQVEGFLAKNEKFSIQSLIGNPSISKRYEMGSMVIGRLCPTDCHRFLFPCDSIPEVAQLINGYLFSVNPIALRKNIHILTQNKRVMTQLKTPLFGTVLFCEIGATSVGSIHQVYLPNQFYKKGDEKGFFSFGGSSIIILFEPNKILFDDDLCRNSLNYLETRCLMGQSLGKSTEF